MCFRKFIINAEHLAKAISIVFNVFLKEPDVSSSNSDSKFSKNELCF